MTKPPANSAEGRARELIDKRLEESGWTVIKEGNTIPNRGNFAVEEVQTDSGPMDYGLIIDGVLIGDVEAKPEGTGVPGIIVQDERYSRNYNSGKFDFDGYHIPFLYSSNGRLIWYRDARSKNNLQREIAGFHTPSALQEYFSLLNATKEIQSRASGTAQKNLLLRDLRAYPVSLPDVDTQRSIVNKIEELLSGADSVEQTINKCLLQAQKQRQSILKSAFEGKLILPYPTAESAEELLRKIQGKKNSPGINDSKRASSKVNVKAHSEQKRLM